MESEVPIFLFDVHGQKMASSLECMENWEMDYISTDPFAHILDYRDRFTKNVPSSPPHLSKMNNLS